jgi:hypothetical protein
LPAPKIEVLIGFKGVRDSRRTCNSERCVSVSHCRWHSLESRGGACDFGWTLPPSTVERKTARLDGPQSAMPVNLFLSTGLSLRYNPLSVQNLFFSIVLTHAPYLGSVLWLGLGPQSVFILELALTAISALLTISLSSRRTDGETERESRLMASAITS